MKISSLIGLTLILLVSALPGCGGGSSGGQNAQATINLTASKTKALANGTDAVTIQAEVKNADGTPVANDTFVAFSASDPSGTLSADAALTSNGLASVTVTSAGIHTITVTAAGGGTAGAVAVKFISQPTSADVAVSFNQPVSNLAALSFNLISSPGITFDNGAQLITAINNASGSLVAGNFNAAAGTNTIGLINGGANGFFTGTAPIIKAIVSIGTVSVLPVFGIDGSPASFMAANSDGGAPDPPVTAASMAVTVTYDSEL